MINKIKLTKEQYERYGTVQWLVNDGPRGCGRTFLLALAFIEKAIDCGYPIPIWDHSTNRESVRHLLDQIHKIMSGIEGYKLEVIHPHDIRNVRISIHAIPSKKDILENGEYKWLSIR